MQPTFQNEHPIVLGENKIPSSSPILPQERWDLPMYMNNTNTKKRVPFPYDKEPFLDIWMSTALNSTLMAIAECNTKNSPKQ